MTSYNYNSRHLALATLAGTTLGVCGTLVSLKYFKNRCNLLKYICPDTTTTTTTTTATNNTSSTTTATTQEAVTLSSLPSDLRSRISTCRTILFDLDGTLVESAQIWFELLNAAARHFGYPNIDRSQWESTFGQSMEKNVQLFMNGLNQQMFNDFCDEHYKDYIDYLEVLPGAVELLEMIKSHPNITMVVCTNCPRAITEIILSHCNFNGYFKHVVCAGDIAHTSLFPNMPAHPLAPKPSIDILVHGADLVNVHTSNCIFIGDSRFDMMAGKEANCITVGVFGIKSGHIQLKNIGEAMKLVELML
jgi:beta-phosphoglucomutase-like phosphatase (HAD superfamily)